MDIYPTLTKPSIYDSVVPTSKLQKLTRIRTGSHSLAIETGRHTRPINPRGERVCECNEVEDEAHFVLQCQRYIHLREQYIGHLPETRLSDVLQMEFAADYISDLEKNRELYKR